MNPRLACELGFPAWTAHVCRAIATSTRTVIIEARAPSIVPTDDASSTPTTDNASTTAATNGRDDNPAITPQLLCLPLQALVTFTVVTVALFDPFEAAVAAIRFIGPVLIEAGIKARLARGIARIF